MSWKCEVCDSYNEDSARECFVCGAPRPSGPAKAETIRKAADRPRERVVRSEPSPPPGSAKAEASREAADRPRERVVRSEPSPPGPAKAETSRKAADRLERINRKLFTDGCRLLGLLTFIGIAAGTAVSLFAAATIIFRGDGDSIWRCFVYALSVMKGNVLNLGQNLGALFGLSLFPASPPSSGSVGSAVFEQMKGHLGYSYSSVIKLLAKNAASSLLAFADAAGRIIENVQKNGRTLFAAIAVLVQRVIGHFS